MAKYSVLYLDPVGAPGKKLEHILEAASDAQARIRFMNLSWVAFTAIYVDSVAVMGGQPQEAKEAAKADPLAGVQPHAYRQRPGAGVGCADCREGAGHPLHRGFEPIWLPVEDRTNASAKASAKAIKAAAAGVAPSSDAEVVAKPRSAGKTERTAAEPKLISKPLPGDKRKKKAPDRIPAVDWQKDVDHLTDRIGKLADRAQSLTRRGKHAEADACRAEARDLAASRAAITKRNKGR